MAVIQTHPDGADQLTAALEAAARSDIYWSNEHFFRWMELTPQRKRWAVFASRLDDIAIDVSGKTYTVRQRHTIAQHSVENFAEALPGAAVAWARRLAKAGRDAEALAVASKALASIDGSGLPWDFHILRNQITALERKMANKPVHRAIQRYLGDDDGYMAERICPYPFERMDLQENGNAAVCCAHWMPGFSLGNVIDGNRTASELYNGEQAIAARRSVLDGSFRYCDHDKCPLISDDRLPTKNDVVQGIATPELTGENVKRGVEKGTLEFDTPSFVLLAFDQSCNLSCPSCRAHVITEKFELQSVKEKLIENSIMPTLKSAKTLNINPAGEIFVSRPLRRLLSRLNSKEFPGLKIDMISNGTLFNRREWEKFPGIHDMVATIRISTDGATKATFEKLRRGAEWEPFLDNMKFLAELRKSGAVKSLLFSFTYQIANFSEMPLFVELTRDIDPQRIVIFEKLENWGTFQDEAYREMAVHRMGHPLHEEFLSVIRHPNLALTPGDIMRTGGVTGDYAGLI
jgi:hypothetical protein